MTSAAHSFTSFFTYIQLLVWVAWCDSASLHHRCKQRQQITSQNNVWSFHGSDTPNLHTHTYPHTPGPSLPISPSLFPPSHSLIPQIKYSAVFVDTMRGECFARLWWYTLHNWRVWGWGYPSSTNPSTDLSFKAAARNKKRKKSSLPGSVSPSGRLILHMCHTMGLNSQSVSHTHLCTYTPKRVQKINISALINHQLNLIIQCC